MAHVEKKGYLVISLDFELFWGMFDKVTLAQYGENVRGERTAIPRILEYFKKYGIHATWATVGMLMARNKEELLNSLPPPYLRPMYEDTRVSAYTYIERTKIGTDETDDVYHYGSDLVRKILATPHQEIANHTFSHFYCIDGHKNPPEIFSADLATFNTIAKSYNVTATSMVFPRNQMNTEALRTCAEHGITAYRGNENNFLYRPRKDSGQSSFIRAFRLLDHYVNLSGNHTYQLSKNNSGLPLNIPASRFLRPWSRVLDLLEPLRMRRIKNSMTHAAKRGEIFHLWWHPHNFGINQKENFKNLEEILTHFKYLQETYGMRSTSMQEMTSLSNTA